MPKRKREHGEPPSRKSARLEEKSRQLPSSALTPKKKEVRREGTTRVLLSPSTSNSAREDHRLIFPLESNAEKPAENTNFQTNFARTPSHLFGSTAAHKRKYEKRLTHSNKRPRKCNLVESPPKQRDNTKSTVRLQKQFGVSEGIEENKSLDPISHWAAHSTWPESFPGKALMASTNSSKRQRSSSSTRSAKDSKPPSYSQSRKDGEVPEQYTAEYERHIFTKGLDMDVLKGEESVSEESKRSCASLTKIMRHSIKPTIFPQDQLRKAINLLGNRNEAIVNRDVTQMIVPPIMSLYLSGDSHLEHAVDEVNADWYEQCVLEGPRIRPDLAIGLFPSSFTKGEIDKLRRYRSVDNWTQVTGNMYFPFLMCEVKCGREGLNTADRQNMHSCSVAVRALLRIEQEADKYRPKRVLESLSGHVLVFSISHDQRDARVYGHYAKITEEKWTYYRYHIDSFNLLTSQKDLLKIHNLVQKVLGTHLPTHVQRLQDAIAALPEPSALSFSTSGMSLTDDSQPNSQERDADGFIVPAIPGASQDREAAKTNEPNDKLLEQIGKLMEQVEQSRQDSKEREKDSKEREKDSKEREKDSKEREKGLERQLEEQRKQMEEQRKQMEEQRKQMEEKQKEIIALLKKSKT